MNSLLPHQGAVHPFPKTIFFRFAIVIAFFSLIFFSSQQAQASHFRGGTITWRVTTGRTVEFTVTTKWRQNATNRPTISTPGVSFILGSDIIQPAVGGVSTRVTKYTATFPNDGPFRVSWGSCCRIGGLGNGGGSWTLFTTVNLGGGNQNSPVSSLPPIVNVPDGSTAATFSVPANDLDGDQLRYRLASNSELNGSNPPGISINSQTGQVSVNTALSNYAPNQLWYTGVVISDGRSEVMIDYLLRITNTSTPPTFVYGPTPVDGTVYQLSPGQSVNFQVRALDSDPNGSIATLFGSGLPSGANFNVSSGNPATSNFSWTPNASDFGTYVLNFIAQDNIGVQASTSVVLQVSLKPRFDSPPTPATGQHNIVVAPGTLINYTVQASDPDPADVVQIVSVQGKDMGGNKIPLYTGAAFSTLPTVASNPTSGTFNWQTQASDWGHRHVYFTARDSYGDETDHEVYQLVNTVPTVSSTAPTEVNVGQTYTYNIVANDPDIAFGDRVDFVPAQPLPNWLTLTTDPATGTAVLNGNPTELDEGIYNISLLVEDINHHHYPTIPTHDFTIEVKNFPVTITPWRINDVATDIVTGVSQAFNGDPAAYQYMNIPPTSDAFWAPAPLAADGSILFGSGSASKLGGLACRTALDFTYFETFINIPADVQIDELKVQFGQVDDGARAYIFNSAHPNGAFKGQIALGNSPVTQDYAEFAVSGELNRLVIVQFDDCATGNNLRNAQITVNGSPIPVDNTAPPVAVVQDAIISVGADGTVSLSASDIDNGSFSTLYGPVTLSVDNLSFDCSDVGSSVQATLTVTDTNGDQTTATATVTVVDNVAPVAVASDITIQLDANGNASITPQDIDQSSSNDEGLVGYWKFDEGSGNTVTDASGNGLNGTFVGGLTWGASSPVDGGSSALNFNDNYIEVADNPILNDLQNEMSIEAWVFQTDAANNTIIDRGNYNFLFETMPNNQPGLGFYNPNGGWSYSSTPIEVNQWVHVAMTWDQSTRTLKFYKNGVLTDTFTRNLDLNFSNGGPINIGRQSPFTCACNRMDGAIDELRLWNTVRTQDEIQSNFGSSITAQGSSSDACGIASLSLDKDSFTCDNVGANTVTLTVTDVNGNSSTATATVTVEDNIAPVAIAQPLTVQLDANGNVSITAEAVNNGSSDACGIQSLSLDNTTFDCSNVGTNTVTLTVTDNNGNSSTAEATITVEDKVAPMAITRPVTVQLDANGNGNITAAQVNNGSSDACGIQSLSLDNTTFDCSNVGTNTVTLTVTDNNGNSSTAEATITVEDKVAPMAITRPVTVQLDANGNGSITAAQVNNGSSDACGIATLSLDNSSFTCDNIGANTVILTVTDNNGNTSSAEATITVEDNVAAEVITQPVTVQLDANGSASITTGDIDNGSSDACGIASMSLDITTFNCSNVGDNEVTLTVTDVNNNVSSATAIVTVVDVIAPTVVTKDIIVALDENGAYTITASDIDGGSFDNCTFDLTIDNNAFNCNTLGENIVNLTATDASGNITTLPATVTVIDNAAPTIVAQPITVELDENGSVSIIASQVDGGTYDNCAVSSITIDMDSFTCDNLGENIVTITATDVNGNTASAPVVVTVIDVIAPTVGVQNISVDLNENGVASISPEDVLLYSEDDLLRDTECDLRSSTLKYVMKLKGDKYYRGSSYSKGKKSSDKGKGKKKDDDDDDDKKKDDDDDDNKGDDDDDDDDKDSKYAQYIFDGTGGKILKRLDGSLSVSGVLVNKNDANDSYAISLELIGAYDYATWRSMDRKAKEVKYETYHLDWTYYTIASGTLTGAGINAGTTVDLGDYSYKEGFQLGNWANGENGDEGLRGKFKGISDDDFKGELKLDVSNCELIPVPEGTVYTSDNCTIVDFSFDQDTFSCNDLTERVVNLTATDQSGNATTVPVTVTVNDRIAPVAVAQDITVSLGANGSVTIDPSLLDGGSTDNTNCALTFTLDRDTFDCDDITKDHSNGKGKGHNYGDDDDDNDPGKGNGYGHKKNRGERVTLTVTDAAGNSSRATAYVTVIDDEAPIISSAPVTVVVYGKKKAYLSKYDVENAVTDNCKVKDIYFRRMKYDRGDVGMNSVQVTASDYSGNNTTGNLMVNVVDISSYGKYVDMCYEGRSIRVRNSQVQNYLRKGASLGSCQYTAKAGSTGTTTEVISDEVSFAPELKLSSYPNPTSGYTVISFSSQIDGPARVAVLSTNGVKMATLFDDELVAKEEVEVGYEAGQLPSGIYIIRMVTVGEVKTLKLVVRK